MSQIRVNKLEGHYTIKIVNKLPKRGNANWLYTLRKDNLSVFYFWTLRNEYEKISISDSVLSITAIQAGTNIILTGSGLDTDPYVINAVPETAQQTPVTPSGNLTSTNVQDALEELQSDFDSISNAEENVQSDWSQTDITQDDFILNKPTNTSDFTNDGADGSNPFITLNDLPDIPEYTLSPISGTNQLDLLKDGVSVSQIDLTPYLDDTNLSRLVSGTLDGTTGILTVTRDDSSTFTIDLSDLIDIQPTNTSDLINDGSDGTSTYVENDEITDAAKVGLSVRDVNNVEQFKAEEFVQIQGATFDAANKRISNDPLEAFTVFIHNTNGNDTTGELNNENKPFATLNNAITAVLTQKGELSNYRFVILDNSTYEIIQPVQDLKTLHIDALSNSPTIVQRTSFGLSEAFILKGFGMTYRIEPDSNFTGAFSTSSSMLSLNSCENVFFEFGGFEFAQNNPSPAIQRAIRYYSNTIFTKFKILGQTSTQQYVNGEWVNDLYTGNIIAEQGVCEDVIFPNSSNLLSKNIIDEYIYTGTGTDTLASSCEMELGGISVPNSGTVRLSFAVSVKLNNATLNNTNFIGQAFSRVDRGNTLSGRATVVWNKNYNYLFNPSGNDTKFSGIPVNNIETNILKDLHLTITSDNQLRCQQQVIRYLDTDFPTQNMVFDNTIIEFDQTNRDIFLTGGTTTTFSLGGAAGWTRDNDTYCLIFRNTNKFFGGAYLFRWLGTLDYNQAKYLVTENGSLEFNGTDLSTNTDLRLHNIDGFDYTYDDISVQDENGVEQFKLERKDLIQFEDFNIDSVNKRIINNTKTNRGALLNTSITQESDVTTYVIENENTGTTLGNGTNSQLLLKTLNAFARVVLTQETGSRSTLRFIIEGQEVFKLRNQGTAIEEIEAYGQDVPLSDRVNTFTQQQNIFADGTDPLNLNAITQDHPATLRIKETTSGGNASNGSWCQIELSPDNFGGSFRIINTRNNSSVRRKTYFVSNGVQFIEINVDTANSVNDFIDFKNKRITGLAKLDLSDLPSFTDDSAAATGGVAVGEGYINSSTGALHRRLT